MDHLPQAEPRAFSSVAKSFVYPLFVSALRTCEVRGVDAIVYVFVDLKTEGSLLLFSSSGKRSTGCFASGLKTPPMFR